MTRAKIVIIVLTASLGGLFAVAESPKSDLAGENAELRAKVEALQQRVATLEKRLNERDAGRLHFDGVDGNVIVPYLPLPPAATQPLIVPPSKPNDLPPGSIQRRINGMTYYVIPCKDQK